MAENRYSDARAVKKDSDRDYEYNYSSSQAKRYVRKIKKSAVLVIISIFVILGGVIGYLGATKLSVFSMNDFYVGETKAQEPDYIVVDVSKIREDLENSENINVSMEEVYAGASLTDKGVTIKFLGFDVSDTLTTKYYYREDISYKQKEVDGIDVTVPGVYYIEYTSSHFAFRKTTLIRTIVITGVEVDG